MDTSEKSDQMIQNYFLHLGQNNADVCTNIPWKFFKNPYRRNIYDSRVKFLVRHLGSVNPARIFSQTNFEGFPDITIFEEGAPECWEVKVFKDVVRPRQKTAMKALSNVGILCHVLNLKTDPKTEYSSQRTLLQSAAVDFWKKFIDAEEFENFRNIILKPNQLAPPSSHTGGYDARIAHTAPNAMVSTIWWYTYSYLFNYHPTFVKQMFKKKIEPCDEEVVNLSAALFHSGAWAWWVPLVSMLPFLSRDLPVTTT